MAEIIEKIITTDEIKTDEYLVNMGPQHPSTHGVLRLLLKLEGEIVHNVEPHVGYIHSGIEKMTEALSYPQIPHLTDRMDYLSSHMNNEAVSLLVENALQIAASGIASIVVVCFGNGPRSSYSFLLRPARSRRYSRYF